MLSDCFDPDAHQTMHRNCNTHTHKHTLRTCASFGIGQHITHHIHNKSTESNAFAIAIAIGVCDSSFSPFTQSAQTAQTALGSELEQQPTLSFACGLFCVRECSECSEWKPTQMGGLLTIISSERIRYTFPSRCSCSLSLSLSLCEYDM